MYLDLLFLLVGMYVLDQSVMSSEGCIYSTISYSSETKPQKPLKCVEKLNKTGVLWRNIKAIVTNVSGGSCGCLSRLMLLNILLLEW